MEHEGDGDKNCNCCTWNNLQWPVKGLKYLKIRGKVEDILTKNPGDLKRLAVAQTPVESHQQTLA